MAAWPITGGTLGSVLLTGDVAASRFGTDGILPSLDVLEATTGLSILAISKAEQKYKKTDEEYKQGSGVQCGRAHLMHGSTWDVTVRDRIGVAFPKVGATITVVDMMNYFNYGIGAIVHAHVFDTPYSATQGQPGERSIILEKITMIETGQ